MGAEEIAPAARKAAVVREAIPSMILVPFFRPLSSGAGNGDAGSDRNGEASEAERRRFHNSTS
jgi:hypothetical protein